MAYNYKKIDEKWKKKKSIQDKHNYEYSKSMYEGATKNRENVSDKTYELYLNDYVNNTLKHKELPTNETNRQKYKYEYSKNSFDDIKKNRDKYSKTTYKLLYDDFQNSVKTRNENILSNDESVSKGLEQTYRYKNAINEKNKVSGTDNARDAILNLIGVGEKGKNDVDYNKKYNDSLKELQKIIDKKGYKNIKAEDLLDYYTSKQNSDEQAKVIEGAEKASKEHPVVMQAARTLTSPLRAQANVANTIDLALNGSSSINGTSDFITNAAYGTRKGLEEKAAEKGLINLSGKKIGPISVNENNEIEIFGNNMGNVNAALYDNIDQMAENVYDSLIFGGGITGGITASGKAEKAKQALINGVFSTSAMGDDLSSELLSGSTTSETVKESVKGAVINFLTEMVGAPLEWADVKGNSTFGKILVSGLNEGTEEIIGNVVDRVYDQITEGQLSELSRLKKTYIDNGMSEKEADSEVIKSMLAEDIFAALQAGFAGSVMSGSELAPNSIIESVQNNIDNKKLGAETKSQSKADIQAIIDEGLLKDKNSKAYKYAEELQAKVNKNKTNGDILTGSSIYDESDYSKISEKRLGQLQVEILKEGFKENIATAVEGEKNESKINRTVNKMVNGIDLNRSDVKAVASSEKAVNAINEQFGSDFTAENITADSLADLSTKLKSGYTDYSFTYDGLNKYQQRAENAQNNAVNGNTQNVPTATQNIKETLSTTQQSDSPKYDVNAVVNDGNNQTAIKIEGKHPFSVSEDKSDIKLRTSAGKVDYENVSIENNAQQILVNEIVNNDFGNAGANAVYLNFAQNKPKNFNGDIRTYVEQAKTIYELGVSKPEMSYTDFVRKNPVFIPSLQLLGDTAVNIFRAGQTDAVNYDNYVKSQRTNKKTPSLAVRHIEGEYTNVSNNDSTIDDVFIKTAKKVGVDIERHSQGKNAGNGQFVPSLAKIIVNADGSGEYNALIHELGEFGLAYNEQAYKEVRTAIRDWFVKEKGAKDFNALVDAYVDTYSKAEGSKTREEALNELTNDAVSGLFSTDEGVESFVNFLDDTKTPTQKKNILETITDFLKSIIEKIKDVIKNSNLQSAAKTAMRMEQKQAEHIRNQFLAVLDGASKNLKNGVEVENETKNSVTLGKFADVDINSDEKLDKYGIPNTANALGDYVNIQKRVISALDNENFFNQNNKNIVVNADTDIVVSITKNGIRETLSTEKRYVKLPRKIKTAKIAVIDNLPDMIRYAEVVNENEKNYHSKEGSSFLVLSHPAIVDGENYNVEIKIKKTPVDNKFYIHNMNLQNKNETVSLNAKDITSRGYNSYDLSRTDNIAKNAIKVKNDDVKYSLDIDSDGNKLTQQQAEYFKNSKVRDENGNLLKVYHGTSENFTVFDKTKGRANMDIQGMFFSPLELDAKDYGSNVNAYYINITNPASEQMGYKALRKFQGQNNAGVKAREYLESLGYDGVNNENEEFIAFDSNQIKLADNLTPTENEDVRFSRDVNTREKDFSKALSKNEYRQFYSIIDNRETGRIVENSAVTIYENDNIDNAKIICYNGNELKLEITAVYRLLGNDETIHGENDLSAQIIAKAEKEKYTNEEIVRLLRTNIEYYGYVLEKYDTKSGRFCSLTGTSRNDSENFENPTNGNRIQQENRYVNFSRDVDYAEYSELKRENKHLKEVNELLKHQFELTNGREVSTNALLKAGRDIKKLTSTRMTGVEVKDVMKTWHTLDTSAQLYNAAYYLAEKLVENEKKQKYQPTEQEQEMLDYLKNTKIKLSDKQKSEVAYYYGSYGKYRNAARGKINITDDGILLDDLSNEMEEMFGNLISNDNSQDLPITLLDLVNTYKDRYIDNEYGYDKQEYLESLANDILSVYFKTPLYETKADKNEKRFLRARSRYAERLEQYRKELASEKEKHEKEFSAFRHEMLSQNREYRENLRQETVQYKAQYRQNYREQKLKAKYRSRIKRNLLKIATLAKQTKTKHIPNDMVNAVKDLIYSVTTDTKFDEVILDKIKNLNNSFARTSTDDTYSYITDLYNNYAMKDLTALEKSIGNKTVAMLNLDELSKLDDIISMTLSTIGKANKLFYAERNKTIESSVSKVTEELEKLKDNKKKDKKKKVNEKKNNKKADFGIYDSLKYGSMKPEYFFEYLGSDELLRLYRDVRKGEDTWAVTVDDSKNYADDVREKYNWKNWNRKKRYEITTAAGDKLNLNLEQLMAIYAMSNRKQTLNHIVNGGVVITDKPLKAIQKAANKGYEFNDSFTHKLSYEDILKFGGMLTEEQKSYVRDMVKYLSTDMAEKGNEISRQLYDVELFKEKNYYPARTAKNYMHKRSTEITGAKKLINSGFTNATIEEAGNPLLLEEFDDVWATHIDEMASYNAFALPLENFDRVYNYQSSTGDEYSSIRTLVENAYGKKATGYISDLLEDLNGGVVHEAGSDITDKFVSMFKKNAVFASASVAIQQPSAIGRALSIIDAKYFLKTTATKRNYEEIKQYAPIAIIKEMGYFDTNMAQSTVDYINSVNYKGLEKVPAIFKDKSFRDDILGIAASKADEITWAHIWNACKAETKDKHPELTGEESLKKAGERFTEVITKTQVYDSVFSRSALMRSKDRLTKVATAFMAEPTTSLNMLVNATVQAKRGKISWTKATRIIASLVIASVINSLLQSIVTAARNDDDDKTYLEVYLSELIPNFIDNANPVNQIAFVKDVANIFKGYDVTRADMDSVSDLFKAVNNLRSDNLTPWKKVQNLAGALGTFIGLPIENVTRDVRGVYNMIHKGLTIGLGVNKSALKSATIEGIKESLLTDDALSLFGLDFFPEKDKNQMIYESIINDDKQMYKRIADNVSNPDNYIKKGLIENDKRVATAGLDYLNGDIKSAINTAKQLESDGFDYELAFKSIKSYASEIEKAAGYKADEDTDKYNNSIDTLTSSGVKKETVEKAIKSVDIDKTEDSDESRLFSNKELAMAVKNDDLSSLKDMVEQNKKVDMANGKSKDEAEDSAQSSIKTALVKGNKNIAQAGVKYAGFDIKSLIDTADKLEKDYEYKTVVKAVKGYTSIMEDAKKALDEKDNDTYNSKLEELTESGMDKATVESAIKKIVVSDSDSKKESQLFNEDDLSAALDSGDKNTIKKVCDSIKSVYIANGSTKAEAEEKLQQKITKAKYGTAKATKVLNNNNTKEIQSFVYQKVNSYIDNGKSAKQAESYTRNALNSIFEKQYKNANADKRAQVLTLMVKTGLYGNRENAKKYAEEYYLK